MYQDQSFVELPQKIIQNPKKNWRLDTIWVKPSWNVPRAAIADRRRPRCLREGARRLLTIELEVAAACLGRCSEKCRWRVWA